MKKSLFLSLLVMGVMTACNFSTTIVVMPGTKNVSADGEVFNLTVTTDNHWTAECDSAWVEIQQKEGSGSAEVSVKVLANPYPAKQSTIIRFRDIDENNLVQVIITREAGNGSEKPQQNPNAPIKVDPAEISAPAEGKEVEVKITAAADMKWIVKSNASWVTSNIGLEKGTKTIKLTIAAAPKNTYDELQAIVSVFPSMSESDDDKSYITITRAGWPAPVFTIDNGRKVMFAPGNLQYQALGNKWRFADHQYTILGNQNKNIDSGYWDYIDLFGWGTSGHNHSKPWLYGKQTEDFYGPMTDDDIEGTDYDWGVFNSDKIENSPNKDYKWFTLSSMDWNEIIEHNVMTLATWNNISGLLIFPDGYEAVGTETFKDYVTYQIDDESWVNEVGAVFLPSAGMRDGKIYKYTTGIENHYWTSTSQGENGAAMLEFSSSYSEAPQGEVVTLGDPNPIRYIGLPVRLAREIKQ